MGPLNGVDGWCILLVLISVYLGYRTGVLAMLFFLASGFAGMAAAQHFGAFPDTKFFLVLIGVSGGVIAAGMLLRKAAEAIYLGTVDRVIGGLCGALVCVCLLAAIAIPAGESAPEPIRGNVQRSYSRTRIAPVLYTRFQLIKNMHLENLRERLPKFHA